jgi:hypothetical protein
MRVPLLVYRCSGAFTILHIDPASQGVVGVPHRAWMHRGASLCGFETAFHAGSWIWSSENSYLLGTRAKPFRRCRTRRNAGTSLRRSTLEDSPTPPAVPCTHL